MMRFIVGMGLDPEDTVLRQYLGWSPGRTSISRPCVLKYRLDFVGHRRIGTDVGVHFCRDTAP